MVTRRDVLVDEKSCWDWNVSIPLTQKIVLQGGFSDFASSQLVTTGEPFNVLPIETLRN